MFWDQEIYCFDDGKSTTGFWSNPIDAPFCAYYGGQVIGNAQTEEEAKRMIEDAFRAEQVK